MTAVPTSLFFAVCLGQTTAAAPVPAPLPEPAPVAPVQIVSAPAPAVPAVAVPANAAHVLAAALSPARSRWVSALVAESALPVFGPLMTFEQGEEDLKDEKEEEDVRVLVQHDQVQRSAIDAFHMLLYSPPEELSGITTPGVLGKALRNQPVLSPGKPESKPPDRCVWPSDHLLHCLCVWLCRAEDAEEETDGHANLDQSIA